MKFAAALIKIFSGALSAAVFGAFLYYTYQYQTTKDTENLFTANIALIVFLISAVTFALLFILFDVYQSKNAESDLVKLLKSSDLNNSSEKTNIADLLVKIASFSNMTNQLLDGHFKEISNNLNALSNNSEISGTNFQNTLEQLTNICGEISQYVDSIKTENTKENQRNAGHNGNFDVLVATVSRLSSDLNDLNGRLLDVVNQISKNVTASIQSHTNIDNEIKELLQKILIAKNENTTEHLRQPEILNTTSEKTIPEENINQPTPQSVADFYEQHFKDIQENEEEKAENAPEEITTDTDILQENEQRIDNLLSTPEQEETFTPQAVDTTEQQNETAIENQADTETARQEKKEPWNIPLSAEVENAEQEYAAVPDVQPLQDQTAAENEPFDFASLDIPVETTESETAADSSIAEHSNNAAGSFSIEASDPFNPSPEHFKDAVENPAPLNDAPISLDIRDEEPVSLDLPNEESNVKLDDIFNDNFASEMADLDILKDNTDAQEKRNISVEDLLADDNDPYNPNK